MIVVTHEMGFARRAAHRVVFMDGGQIVEEADPETFFTAPTQRPRTRLPVQDPHPLTHPRTPHEPTRHRTHTRRGHTMRRGRLVLALAAAATLSLAGCSSGDDDDSRRRRDGRHVGQQRRRRGHLKIGIKFDQPGLGYKDGRRVHRLRRRRREVRRGQARLRRGPDRVRPVAVGAARDPAAERPGRHDLRDLLDHRQAQGGRLLRRSVLRRRAGPPGRRGRRLDQGPRGPRGQEPLLGDRLDVGAAHQGRVRGRHQPARAARVRRVRHGPDRRHGRRRHHRRHHPGRPGRRARQQGQGQGRRQPVLRGELRRRPAQGQRQVRGRSTRRSPR